MATTPQTAVAVTTPRSMESWEPHTVALLGQFPPDKYNVLVPTVSLRQINPYLVPDIEAVQLDPNPEAGEIYHDPQMKAGHYGPTKVGLRLLAQVAGITTVRSERIDDGSDIHVVTWQVEIEMVQPSGRPIRGIGSKTVDLRPHMTKGWTPERLAKAHEHMGANAESKAMNRAIRSILSLRPSYPQRELAKPFAILRYVPDMTQPEVRERFLDLVAPTTAALYGPDREAAGPKLVGPGAAREADVAAEAPDDDDDAAAEAFAAASETAATTDDVPDWAKPPEQTAAAAPKKRPGAKTIPDRLRESLDASELQGDATDSQKLVLRGLVVGLDWATELVPVLTAAFGDEGVRKLTAAHVQAILNLAEAFEAAEPPIVFVDAWRAAAAALQS